MRHAFFIAVTVISCSVCAFGDLEMYPGINLEDQRNNFESPDGSFSLLYRVRRWHEKGNWPRLQHEYFGDGQDQLKFKAILDAAKHKKIRDLLHRQRELKDTIDKSMKNFVVPDALDHSNDDFPKFLGNEMDGVKYPNQYILEGVRPYPQQNSNFDFHDEGDVVDNNADEEEIERIRDTSYYLDANVDIDSNGREVVYDAKLSDPNTQFAYSPSDPRFYEDSSLPESKVQREVFNTNTNEINNQQLYPPEIEPDTNRISYTGAYQEIMDDPRDRPDGSVKVVAVRPSTTETDTAGVYVIAIVAGISAAATVGLIAFGIGWYNLQKHVKNASDVEYPAYGITGPNKEISPSGDRRLAQSAQMYHYQHQKQQIIAMERAADGERHGSVSEADSDEENEEGDYTVYEYAGLAPIGEMEVKNPLFQDEPTPAQTPAIKPNENDVQKK